jgi:hypothetical protein
VFATARRTASIAALVAVASLIPAAAASAHGTYVTASDGSRAHINSAHTVVSICDNDPDGNYAYVRFTNGGSTHWIGYDHDGYGGSCYPYSIPGAAITFNACVQTEGCGQPKWYPGTGTPTW